MAHKKPTTILVLAQRLNDCNCRTHWQWCGANFMICLSAKLEEKETRLIRLILSQFSSPAYVNSRQNAPRIGRSSSGFCRLCAAMLETEITTKEIYCFCIFKMQLL